ncbi:MAG: IS3 family transposase [Ardenticatenales bacterium]|nr:IS3 family transposase [Ardenticatenales bacterium]
MARGRKTYPAEYRQRLIEMARAGRSAESLGRDFEPTAQTIRNWVAQADRDEGRHGDGLTTAEREELRQLRRDNRRLQQELEILKSDRHLVCRTHGRRDTQAAYAFVTANQDDYPTAVLCQAAGVSSSGYYAARGRIPSKRAQEDTVLTEEIKVLHSASRGTYGAPRIHEDLMDQQWRIGRKRVARLMRGAGLQGVSRRKGTVTTRHGTEPAAADLVRRDFGADGPNRLWVADITYVPTWAGFLYLAVVIDAWSRKVVGWSMATHMRQELVMDALTMAATQREASGVIHHSDHGSQYTSLAFGSRCDAFGIRVSMGSVGDCYDNAMAESFFASLECELIDRSTFRSHADARIALFDYIEAWYNPHRRHSALGQLSPVNFERRADAAVAA